LQFPYPDEIITMHREIAIPPNATVGRYRVQMGLLNGRTLRRLWPHTELPTRRLKTILPLEITITAGPHSAPH
jgi:hypothetical protein